ncbi:MAG TPA: agmatine deiminase family protein [Kofleriaceae bacterium]|nr:agmatine deiminase family protein [Kofleriaceae bacterium]
MKKIVAGVVAGLVVSALVVRIAACFHHHRPHTRLVAEDASAALKQVAIHYAPSADRVAMPVWKQLFAVLPAEISVEVEVAQRRDFDRLIENLGTTPHLDRLHPVVVGSPITTWSRDRYASLADDRGGGEILAPPRIEAPFVARAGDARSPDAISHELYHRDARIADIVFEGGDLAATPDFVFADVNLAARNLGRAQADRAAIEHELHARFAQQLIWLGDVLGDVPRHHIMMYMVPLDAHTVAVGDVRAGVALLGVADDKLVLDDVELQARRFDHAAELLAARGFRVVRVPALVLAGAGSFVTYTNALFDRRGDQRIVYLPTYAQPALDDAARKFYESEGFEVHPIDVSSIYRLNGSLGCLVNVLARE